MKTRIVICLLLLFGSMAPAQPWTEDWLTNFDKALAVAKAENKRVLLDFTGSDWCGPCIALKKNVFTQPEFMGFAAKNLVLVELDFPRRKTLPDDVKAQNERLLKQFGADGYPTIVLLGPDGKTLGQFTGYDGEGPAEFIAKLEKLSGK